MGGTIQSRRCICSDRKRQKTDPGQNPEFRIFHPSANTCFIIANSIQTRGYQILGGYAEQPDQHPFALANAYNSIDKIDEKNQIAYLKNPEDGPDNNNGLLVVPPRYFVENVKALLGTAGEWFFDKEKKEISYIRADGISDPNHADISVPQINKLVQLKGDENHPVRNLRFYGLTFEGAKENFRNYPHYYGVTPGCIAISYEYASDCELVDSKLRACGGLGMTIGFGCFDTRAPTRNNTKLSLKIGR